MKRYGPYLAGTGVAFVFGLSFMFTSGALEHVAPFHLLGLRFASAALFMAGLRLIGMLRFRAGWQDFLRLLPLALFQPLIYFTAETTGVLLTSSSYAGMMIAVIPIVATIFSALFLGETPAIGQIPFILASVGGVLFIAVMDSQSAVGANTFGTLALLAAVVAAACYNIASRKASVTYKPIQTTWVMMVVGAVVFNVIALGQAGSLDTYLAPLTLIWPAVIYLGIVSSVIAFFLLNYSLSHITATQSAVFANLVTVIAITAGVVFRNESFFWYHALGSFTILAGVWGTNYYSAHRRKIAKEVA